MGHPYAKRRGHTQGPGAEQQVRAVIFHQHDDVRVEEVPVPAIGEGEVLLRVAGCGLCGSDILKITSQAKPPVALGHELTGTVVESRTPRFVPGQRLVVSHHVPCGQCAYCLRGSPTMCVQFKATNLDPCGLAEYVRVPAEHAAHTALPLPEGIDDQTASFAEPLACCLRALGRAHLETVEDVALIGLGAMGLLMLQALLARRPGVRVIGLDLLADRRELALELGACMTLDPSGEPVQVAEIMRGAHGRGVDLAVLAVGAPSALALGQALVRDGGELVVFAAQPGTPIGFDLWDAYHRELRLTASYSSAPSDLRSALDMLVAGRTHVDRLVSHRLPLEAFHEGVALVRARHALKVYFVIRE
jgi:L-iditol 2-dehydrogenase